MNHRVSWGHFAALGCLSLPAFVLRVPEGTRSRRQRRMLSATGDRKFAVAPLRPQQGGHKHTLPGRTIKLWWHRDRGSRGLVPAALGGRVSLALSGASSLRTNDLPSGTGARLPMASAPPKLTGVIHESVGRHGW
jgi:hypothetical protein